MPDQFAPATLSVGGQQNAVVMVNKLLLDGVMKWSCERKLNMGAGTCSISVSDPNKELYDIFQPQDELEIFVSKTTVGGTVARKIWGGFIDTLLYSLSGGDVLEISGKEYISRLQSQVYPPVGTPSAALNGTFNVIMREVLSAQVDFTYEGIPDTMLDAIISNVKNDTIFNTVRQMIDQVGGVIYLDPETRDISARYAFDSVTSPDAIIEGDKATPDNNNLLRSSSTVSKNSDYLTNTIVVNYDNAGGTPATWEDTAEQSNWGTFARVETVGNITGAAEAQLYGQTLVNNRKYPSDGMTLNSGLLLYTDPGHDLTIISPQLGLNGVYPVLKLNYFWSPREGITEKVTVNAHTITTGVMIADISERLKRIERQAYMG